MAGKGKWPRGVTRGLRLPPDLDHTQMSVPPYRTFTKPKRGLKRNSFMLPNTEQQF